MGAVASTTFRAEGGDRLLLLLLAVAWLPAEEEECSIVVLVGVSVKGGGMK
jgi:hypothetical protein